MENGGSHSSTAVSAGKHCGDATAPAMAASVPDINTDSRAERFTISLAVVADGVEQVAGLLGTGQGAVGAEPAQRRQRLVGPGHLQRPPLPPRRGRLMP